MRLLPVLLVSLSLGSFGLINPNQSLSANLVAQLGGLDGLEDIEDATTSILDTLGYDCQTAAIGIVCTKCSDDDGLTQNCKAYLCDAVTRDCRKQEAQLPRVPDSVEDLTDDIDVPDSVEDLTDDIDVPDSVEDITGDIDVPDSVEDLTDDVDIDIDTDDIPGL